MSNEKIVIQEFDLTKNVSAPAPSDIVYVPGLIFDRPVSDPKLYTSVADFEADFGSSAPSIDKELKHTITETVGNKTTETIQYTYVASAEKPACEISYMYAKSMLEAGLPVLFENLVTTSDAAINETGIVDNIKKFFEVNDIKGTVHTLTMDFTAGEDTEKKYNALEVNTDGTIKYLTAAAGEGGETTGTTIISKGKLDNSALKSSLNIHSDKALEADALDFFNTVGSVKASGSLLNDFYTACFDSISALSDRNEFNLKYMTLGGYPSCVYVLNDENKKTQLDSKMVQIAYDRGDCVAILDYLNENADWKTFESDMNERFNGKDNTEYATMFAPWRNYNLYGNTVQMPGSFAYLRCLANAIKTNPNWLAIAGVTRGQVSGSEKIASVPLLTNVIAENFQPKFGAQGGSVSINCITDVKPYGETIWGNRTLKTLDTNKSTTATHFLNTRNMVSDIKKLAYQTAKSLMFEQDSDALWLKFKSGMSALLDQLKSGNGISEYKVIRTDTRYDGTALVRGEIAATIRIVPITAVEYFEITVVMADQDVTVE